MKKWWIVIPVLLLLTGCASEPTAETVADEWYVPAAAQPREVNLSLPGEALSCAVDYGSSRYYIGDSYEISVQTMSSGDLSASLRSLTGFSEQGLTVLKTMSGEIDRYEFVWASADENGARVGQGVILDDGEYHYCLSVLRDPEVTDCQIVWSEVLRSFELV